MLINPAPQVASVFYNVMLQIFMKLGMCIELEKRNNCYEFGINLDRIPETGIFKGFFNIKKKKINKFNSFSSSSHDNGQKCRWTPCYALYLKYKEQNIRIVKAWQRYALSECPLVLFISC